MSDQMIMGIATWGLKHKDVNPECLGLLPAIVLDFDPRPAAEQINDRYQHGGGWSPMKGWHFDGATEELHYGTEFPIERFKPLAGLYLPHTNEGVIFYEGSWVMIYSFTKDTFEVSRMD